MCVFVATAAGVALMGTASAATVGAATATTVALTTAANVGLATAASMVAVQALSPSMPQQQIAPLSTENIGETVDKGIDETKNLFDMTDRPDGSYATSYDKFAPASGLTEPSTEELAFTGEA